MWRRLLLVLVAGLPACLALPPAHTLNAEHGRVRACSIDGAVVVSRLLDELAPRVHALLPDTRRDRELEVWVQRELAVYSNWPVDREVPAFTIDGVGRIHMLEGEAPDLSAALSHELVHALLGPTWDPLPPVVEEGLADWAQEQLHGESSGAMRADHLAKASAAFGGLRFGLWTSYGGRRLASFTYLGPGAREGEILDPVRALGGEGAVDEGWRPYQVSVSDPRLYGVGYLLVTRIVERSGMAGLHGLCLQAAREKREQVPVAWLLEAAALDRDPDTWRRAILDRIGEDELLALGASLAPFLAEMISQELGRYTRAPTGAEFLERIRPRLGIFGVDVVVPLSALPGLLEVLEEGWDERPRSSRSWRRRGRGR